MGLAFDILNQPFEVKWLTQQDNLDIAIDNENLHILGTVMGKLFYLSYKFIHESGILKLVRYEPLFKS